MSAVLILAEGEMREAHGRYVSAWRSWASAPDAERLARCEALHRDVLQHERRVFELRGWLSGAAQ